MRRIAIVGAGVAGLSVAFELLERRDDLDLTVYESGDEAGGNIRTDLCGGFTVERGPNGFLDNVPETLDLIRRLGIADRLMPASQAAKKRYIYRGGTLHEVKANPLAFMRSDLLSWRGKLDLACEPFSEPAPPDEDRTVFDFAARHIGPEAATVLVQAMVSGVFAGDGRELSLRSAFPRMHEMESAHGSLIRAMIARLRERRLGEQVGGPAGPAGHLTSFVGGMSDLVAGLCSAVGRHRIRLATPVSELTPRPGGGVDLALADGGTSHADAAVVAVPAWDAVPIVGGSAPGMARELGDIPGAGLSVVAAGFNESDLPAPLDGFGFLVPPAEGLDVLGCLWTSSIFPGRAPDGSVLLRTMVGGAHRPELNDLDDDALVALVLDSLRATMGVTAEPTFQRICRYPRGIPQYTVGHSRRVAGIEAACRQMPGLYVAGNSYAGIAVNSCVKEAGPLAERVIAGLA